MNYDEVRAMETTLSPNNSEKLFAELLLGSGWRCYSTKINESTDKLISRFLQSHAMMPGYVTDEIPAIMPIEVFRHSTGEGVVVQGALFTNGAVATVMNSEREVRMLFVNEPTATRWSYPEGYLIDGKRVNEESTERSVQT